MRGATDLGRYLWPDIDEGRQPQSQVIVDFSNPFSLALRFAYVGSSRRNLANNAPPVSSVSVSIIPTTNGLARLLVAANQSADGFAIPGFSGDITILVIGKLTPRGTVSGLCHLRNGSDNNFRALLGEYNTDLRFVTQPLGGSAVSTSFGSGTNTGVYIGVLSGTAQSSYANGVLVSSATQSLADWSDSAFTRVGGGTFTEAVNGEVSLACVWRRALSGAEIASISANPWQLFAQPTANIWPTAAIGGLPTLSASTYTPGSLSSVGWRPRITAT